MRVLIGCERFGILREEFRIRGHDAWSCDFEPTEIPGNHIQEDLRFVIGYGWDLMIAHPDCTYLCSSGLHWNYLVGRQRKTIEALAMVRLLMNCDIPKIAIENPVGCIGSRIRKPDQIIQPYQFGEDASKATCLWLKNLPLLWPTQPYPPTRIVNGKPRWGNQCDGGQDKTPPSPYRSIERAKTYKKIAEAMADQWGRLK